MVSFEDQIFDLKEESNVLKNKIQKEFTNCEDEQIIKELIPLFDKISLLSETYNTDFKAAKFYINDAIIVILNRTLLKKHRLLKHRNFGFQFDSAINTLHNAISFLESRENRIVGFEWADIVKLFAISDCFVALKKFDEGFRFIDNLRSKLNGTINYYLEDAWNNLIEDDRERFFNRLKLQYDYWTLPNLKLGNTLMLPDIIIEHEFAGNKFSRNGGEYYNCFEILAPYLQKSGKDNSVFDGLYSMVLEEDRLEEAIELFNDAYFSKE